MHPRRFSPEGVRLSPALLHNRPLSSGRHETLRVAEACHHASFPQRMASGWLQTHMPFLQLHKLSLKDLGRITHDLSSQTSDLFTLSESPELIASIGQVLWE